MVSYNDHSLSIVKQYAELRDSENDLNTPSHPRAHNTLSMYSHALTACDNAAALHLMHDISEHENEDNDAHTAIHGPRRALEPE